MILDTLVSYVCAEPPSDVPGAAAQPLPAPLLPNGGAAQALDYMSDLVVSPRVLLQNVGVRLLKTGGR